MIIQQKSTVYSAGTAKGRLQEEVVLGAIGLAKVELLPRALPGPAGERCDTDGVTRQLPVVSAMLLLKRQASCVDGGTASAQSQRLVSPSALEPTSLRKQETHFLKPQGPPGFLCKC